MPLQIKTAVAGRGDAKVGLSKASSTDAAPFRSARRLNFTITDYAVNALESGLDAWIDQESLSYYFLSY